jgi:hypothetical protein
MHTQAHILYTLCLPGFFLLGFGIFWACVHMPQPSELVHAHASPDDGLHDAFRMTIIFFV